MLSEPRRRQKWTLNPRGNLWSKDENKLGNKLMEKMGWETGKGLGAKQDGMLEPIQVKKKEDKKGIGHEGHDDTWLAHQDDFQAVLAALNEAHNGGGENVKPQEEAEEETDKRSLEASSKKSKKRVHYHKFTRGKDLANYSKDDLGSILGFNSAKRNPKPESEPSTPDEEDSGEETPKDEKFTVQKGSYQEYFAKKMAEMKARGKPVFLPEEYHPIVKVSNAKKLDDNGDVVEKKTDENDLEQDEPKKKKKSKVKSEKSDNSDNDQKDCDESLENVVHKKKKKSKKEKKVHDDSDVQDEKVVTEDVTEEAMPKKKKKSKKNKDVTATPDVEIDSDITAEEDFNDESVSKSKKKKKKKDREEESEKKEESSSTDQEDSSQKKKRKKKTKKSKKEKTEEETAPEEIQNDSGCDESEQKIKKKKREKKKKDKISPHDDEYESSKRKSNEEDNVDEEEPPRKKSKKEKKQNSKDSNSPLPSNYQELPGFKGSNILALPGYGTKI